jgi:uncharacterized Rmd1/YagE family protein
MVTSYRMGNPAGRVKMSRKEIAQLLGKVFIQRSAVNLLSTVLDTPEFFWSAPDSMQSLYKKVCEYMELDDRVEVLNNRYGVRANPRPKQDDQGHF